MSVPVSFSQEERLHLGRHVHCDNNNVVVAYEITGPLRADLLVRSVEAVTVRHEALRSSFTEDGFLRIAAEGTGTERVTADSLESAVEIVIEHWGRRYDLTHGPLLRSTLVEISPQRHVLALLLDHSIVDGWSLSLISDELLRIYADFAAGRSPDLPDAPKFSDFVLREREQLQGERLDRTLRYWERQLAGTGPLPASSLPGSGEPAQSEVDTVSLPLDPALVEDIVRFAKAAKLSVVPVYVAALANTIKQHQVGEPAGVGMLTMVANRTDPATDPLVGYLATRAAIKVDLDATPSFAEQVARAGSAVWGALRHQRVPHSLVVKHLAPHLYGVLGTTPDTIPPHVYFNTYADRTEALPQPSALTITQLPIPIPRVPRGGLDVGVRPSNGRVSLQFKYLTRRYSRTWIQSFAEDMRHNLRKGTSR